jgi:hypothetical protein
MFGLRSFRAVTAGPQRERGRILKSKGKMKAGAGSAQTGQQRLVKASQVKKSSGHKRKSVEMKNTLEMTPQNAAQAPSQDAAAQELFGPQEWDALLNSFENEPQSAAPAQKSEGEIELSSDDLWERLSSTRWLREPAADIDRASTIAQRPSS